jgi:hypothetical protein
VSTVAHWLQARPTHTKQVSVAITLLGLNLSRTAANATEIFCGFPQSLHTNAEIVPRINEDSLLPRKGKSSNLPVILPLYFTYCSLQSACAAIEPHATTGRGARSLFIIVSGAVSTLREFYWSLDVYSKLFGQKNKNSFTSPCSQSPTFHSPWVAE